MTNPDPQADPEARDSQTPQTQDAPVDAEIVEEPSAVVPASPATQLPDPDYTEGGVPSFDYVRSRIEGRSATAEGSQELAGLGGSGPDVKSLDEELDKRKKAGADKLAEIRKSMGL
ncbi:PspA/IM30 family protein [Actinokineospora pegani]|uniref:hypothetical protein n=1 Tax=Actinokineospora pegani TaxID=2654637 RepID=UPI001F46CFB4|nr:hypothetical protein [Actinokineospora pegani]